MAEIEFQPGESIVPMSRPFVKSLHQSHKGRLCDFCLEPGMLNRCSGCQMMHYCGKKCQKLDWKEGHSVECKSELFKNPKEATGGMPVDPNLAPKLFRTLAKFHVNPDSFMEKHPVYEDQQRSFNDMMSHDLSPHDGFLDFMTLRLLTHLFSKLKYSDSSFGLVDFDEAFLKRIFGVWKTNGFVILNLDETQTIGAGLYIPHSAIDHACRPNAVRISKLDQMEIRCIHPIPKGEKPRISYLAGNRTPDERKSVLQSRYNFTCECPLCLAEESGPLIDYNQLGLYKNRLVSFYGPSYQTVTGIKDKCLELFRKLYHEYDERITNFCSLSFDIIHQWQLEYHNVPRPFLRKEAADLEKRLRVTFGTESNDYVEFQRKLKQLRIDLAAKK